MKIQSFHHVALRVQDLAEMERFYREVLGLPVLTRWPDGVGGDRSVWLAVGDGFLALERASAGHLPLAEGFRAAAPGIHLVAFRISRQQREEVERDLRARGVEIQHRTPWTLFFRDPEGNRIGLSHHPESADRVAGD